MALSVVQHVGADNQIKRDLVAAGLVIWIAAATAGGGVRRPGRRARPLLPVQRAAARGGGGARGRRGDARAQRVRGLAPGVFDDQRRACRAAGGAIRGDVCAREGRYVRQV